MKIGIDIDDTTVFTVKPMIKYADLFDKEILKRKGSNNNFGKIKNRYYLEELYGWDEETKYKFFNLYYKNVLEECELIKDADTVINNLKKLENEIFFVTARLTNIEKCDTKQITIDTLNKNNILYDKLILDAKDKLKVCKEYGIEMFIEDSYETCIELEQNGIKTFLMSTKMNKDIQTKTIERVNSWLELYNKFLKR